MFKRTLKTVIFVFFCLFTLTAQSQPVPTGPAAASQPTTPAPESPRSIAKAECLVTAMKVAGKAGMEAMAVAQFIKDHGVLAEPVASTDNQLRFRMLESAKSGGTNWFAIIPLLPTDKSLGSAWDHIGEGDIAAAHFLPDVRALIVKNQTAATEDWNGALILHEGYHAKVYITGTPYNWMDPAVFCEKERDAHAFENRILSAVGGKKYTEYVEATVESAFADFAKTGKKVGEKIIGWSGYDVRLDKIFGPAKSPWEQKLRTSHVGIHKEFRLLEKYFQGEVERKKTDVLCAIYKQIGVLPPQIRP